MTIIITTIKSYMVIIDIQLMYWKRVINDTLGCILLKVKSKQQFSRKAL